MSKSPGASYHRLQDWVVAVHYILETMELPALLHQQRVVTKPVFLSLMLWVRSVDFDQTFCPEVKLKTQHFGQSPENRALSLSNDC